MVAITTVDGNYLIDAKEVTTAEFALFLDAVKTGAFEPTDARCDWKAGTDYGGGAPKCPTTPAAAYGCADWCDAIEYCTWAKKRLCGKIGGGPVDENDTRDLHRSQWTRACAGQTSAMSWPYGATAQSVCNTKERGVAAALAPASSAACVGSAAGLFDMSGNVGEWEDACTAIGPTGNCSIRGGSFKQTIDGARCSGELLGLATGTFGDVGIRCCKDM
ncbi:MAG: hypothetical protein JWP87_4903 [Labilithrix sp.]|nr:hypothetical protein [Labilithrix sp.]